MFKRIAAACVAALLFSLPAPCVAAADEPGGSQLESGSYNSVRTDGQYEIIVPGKTMVGPGTANIPWRFFFSDPKTGQSMESVFLANALPMTPDTLRFGSDWLGTAQYIQGRVYDSFGDLAAFISFDSVPITDNDHVYVMYLILEDPGQRMEITACWRFAKSYYCEYLGINLGDMPEMFELTKQAARSFQDLTEQPFSANPSVFSTGQFYADPGPWELPVNHTVGLIREFTRWYYPEEASPERLASDYEISWESDWVERVARELTGIASGPVRSSDLDRFQEIRLVGGAYNSTSYRFSVEEFSVSFETDEPISNLDDLAQFSRVTNLHIDLKNVTDISGIAGMAQVDYLNLSINNQITDLSAIGELKSLETLFMWGTDYHRVTDLSFFKQLQNLETVYFIDKSIKDASVFCEIPSLRALYLNAHDDLDKESLIGCDHIVSLMLNTETIR